MHLRHHAESVHLRSTVANGRCKLCTRLFENGEQIRRNWEVKRRGQPRSKLQVEGQGCMAALNDGATAGSTAPLPRLSLTHHDHPMGYIQRERTAGWFF
jgi:hypothetical protein